MRNEFVTILKSEKSLEIAIKNIVSTIKTSLDLKYKQFINGNESSLEIAKYKTLICDDMLSAIHEHSNSSGTNIDLVFIAIKGYGRLEIAPNSDLDVVVLLPEENQEYVTKITEVLTLITQAGIEITPLFSTREKIVDYAKNYMRHFLEMRFIAGNEDLYEELKTNIKQIINEDLTQFLLEQMQKWRYRHEKNEYNPYFHEPNLLLGPGGLYDIRGLRWVSSILFNEDITNSLENNGYLSKKDVRTLNDALTFLWDIRTHLHLIYNENNNQIKLSVQEKVAKSMGYKDSRVSISNERLMRHFFLTVTDVSLIASKFFISVKENIDDVPAPELLEDYTWLSKQGEYLLNNDKNIFATDPTRIIEVFNIACQNDLMLHPMLLELISNNLKLVNIVFRANPINSKIFLNLLFNKHNSAPYLRAMSNSGLLSKFIPQWGKVLAYLKFSSYHAYTTSEHTLQCLNFISQWNNGTISVEEHLDKVIPSIVDLKPLIFALFCHDLNKDAGKTGGDAEKLTRKIGRKLQVSPENIDTAAWLVSNQKELKDTAFHSDLTDQKVITKIAKLVQIPEQFKLLMAMTISNLISTGPEAWSDVKSKLMSTLYKSVMVLLNGGEISTNINDLKTKLIDQLTDEKWDSVIISKIDSLFENDYLTDKSLETCYSHACLLKAFLENDNKPQVTVRKSKNDDNLVVSVISEDRVGLFSDGCYALSLCDTDITSVSLHGVKSIGWHEFYIPLTTQTKNKKWQDHVVEVILKAINKDPLPSVTPSSVKSFHTMFKVPTKVSIDNTASSTSTRIEVVGRNRKGFLYLVSSLMQKLNLNILSARSMIYGERLVNVIYVTQNNEQFTDPEQHLNFEEAIKKLLS